MSIIFNIGTSVAKTAVRVLMRAQKRTPLPHQTTILPVLPVRQETLAQLRKDPITLALNQSAWYNDTRALLQNGKTITRVVVNFPLRWVNKKYSHPGGNAYLMSLSMELAKISSSVSADIRIYRKGPTFEIDLPEGIDAKSFMEKLYDEFAENKLMFKVKTNGGKPKKVSLFAAANIGGWRYDPKIHEQVNEVGDLKIASAMCMSRLNRQGKAERKDKRSLRIDNFDAEAVFGFAIRERIPDAQVGDSEYSKRISDARGWKWFRDKLKEKQPDEEKFRTAYIEPDSGLFNMKALGTVGPAIVEEMQESGGDLTIGFMDGNKIGAFIKSYGFLGDTMVDAIISRRIAYAATKIFAERGIVFVRTGPGSEEFWMIGKDSPEEIAEDIKEFVQEVNRPLYFKVKVGELRKSEDGKKYIVENNFFGLGNEDEIMIDLTRIGRGGGHSGITFTGALQAVNPLSGEQGRETFRRGKEQVELVGELAKQVNFERIELILRVDGEKNLHSSDPGTEELAKAAQALWYISSFENLSQIIGPAFLFALKYKKGLK